MKGYLAGPINACSDDEVTAWRETVKATCSKIEWVDPADRDFRGVEDETFTSIVEGDKADIDRCDFVLAFCWQPSYGTAMELLYAWEREIPVIAVVPESAPVSPWVQYHATIVARSLEDGTRAVSHRFDE